MSNNIEKIALLTTERKNLSDALPALIAREKNWRLDSQKPCNYSLKSKREKCKEERNRSLITAEGILGDINNVKDKIAQIDIQIKALNDAQTASNTANVTLAQKGQSLEALTIKAQGESKAIVEAATIKANAEANAINKSADNSKQRNLIFIIIAIIIAFVIGYILYTKYKK